MLFLLIMLMVMLMLMIMLILVFLYCVSSEKFAMLFDEPVLLQANMWYVAWARISGPSSDCGSSGQTVVTTDDQYV